jgi:hypothetical protein
MWKLYVPGREGVAIQTTVGALRSELNKGILHLGRVTYQEHTYEPLTADYDGIPFAAWFLFRKAPGYAHEREIRAVLFDNGLDAGAVLQDTIFRMSSPRDADNAKPGEAIQVNLARLIQRIVVSPEFPRWAIRSLQNLVDSANIGAKVEHSGLLDQPSVNALG